MRQLTPKQAYRLGLIRGFNRAQAQMRRKADQWEAEIVALQDDFETLVNEVRCVRDAQAIDEAVTERAMYPDICLH